MPFVAVANFLWLPRLLMHSWCPKLFRTKPFRTKPRVAIFYSRADWQRPGKSSRRVCFLSPDRRRAVSPRAASPAPKFRRPVRFLSPWAGPVA